MLPGWLRLCLCALILCGSVGASAAPGAVVRLQVDGVIGPASADYLVRGLAKAVDEGAQLVLIEIDTPGGLDSSMRAIIKAILASPIPVASYVAPGGARAASAGIPARNRSAAAPSRVQPPFFFTREIAQRECSEPASESAKHEEASPSPPRVWL